MGLESGFTGLNNSRQSSVALERINDVAAHMLTQYADCQNSRENAMTVFTEIYENMQSVCDYFRQTFAARGVSVDNIYCQKDQATQSIVLSILWQKIGFTMMTNDRPQALHRQDGKKVICYRILATKGDCIKIINENPENMVSKLLEFEVASLYVPANKNDVCEMRVRHLSNEIHSINQQLAAREVFLKVVEYTCGGGSLHVEKEFPGIIY